MLDIIIIIVPILVPLIFSGLLSATETAITAISVVKLHKFKNDGNKSAAIISKLREDKETLISTILIANNACAIFSSTLATAFLIKVCGDEAVVYATVIMTLLIVIFAEILPKTYAIANPEAVALLFARVLQISVTVCNPLTRLLNKIVFLILKIFNVNFQKQQMFSPTDEIKGAIDLHHQEGTFAQSNKFMLDGVFYLSETNVSQVMTHRRNMQTINIDLGNEELIAHLRNIGHSRIPAWRNNPDNIIGILNTKDLLHEFLVDTSLGHINISDLISEPIFIPENTSLDEQLADFKIRKTRFALVIDEYGEIQGLITLSDILEEVVGRIQDEHDEEKNEIILEDGFSIVEGQVTIRDINRMLNWNLPDEDASTVAGLLIHEAERIPELDEELSFYGFDFTVLAKENNQITKVKIKMHDN